ncbi:MAG: outer membrane lipoprotein-sorting protein [Myxococcales bacterium]|nr:outer membrane lipoprotein-sorting protein [Myxococcales bacterium]MCB9733022.1 outer membrane lipoprotein-sorting protein [Deltaproteobacteria bacterium]
MNTAPRARSARAATLAPLLVLLALTAATGPSSAADDPPPEALAREALASAGLGFEAGEATLRMRIDDGRGHALERTLTTRTRIDGDARETRITFTEPADQRGVELLTLERGGGEPAQYLWLPALGKATRIAGSALGGKFQGSDFTFGDLARRDVPGRFVARPAETLGKERILRVDVLPAEGDGEAAFGRVELGISERTRALVRVAFHDRAGELVRELAVTRLSKVGDRYVPTRLVMSDRRAGSKTTLEVTRLDPDARFPATVFAPESLGR